MGLFKELVLLPLAPVRGTLWVTEQIAQEAEAQLYDEDRIKRELIQLYLFAVLFVLGCIVFAYGCGVYHGWY